MKLMNRWSFEEDKIDPKPWNIFLLLLLLLSVKDKYLVSSILWPCHAFVL